MTATDIWTDVQTGPASYPTGGFVITTSLSNLAAFEAIINAPGSNLGRVRFVYLLNTPSAGQVTIKVMRTNYKLYGVGAPTGLPSGVTAPTTAGQTVAAESSHTMDITHGHAASAASAAMAGATPATTVTQVATGGVNESTHTHTVTISSAAFTSGAGSSHTHTSDNIYQHQHAVTNTQTDMTLTELPNGTDLSGATLNLMGVSA